MLPLQPRVVAAVALAAKAGVGGKGPKDDEGEAGGGLMPPAELRAALKKADTRGRASSCVVGLTRDKRAVILVDHLPKPRKLLAQVKAQGQAAGLDLDVPSLRFGRVSVSGRQVDITVNKAVAPAVELKLRPVMRAAAHPVFTINADPAIEDEPEDSGSQDGAGQETPGQVQDPGVPPVASPSPAPGPSAGNPPGVRPGPAAPAAAQAPGMDRNGADGNGAAPDATGAAGRAALLAAVPPDLVAGVRAALSADPGRKGELAGLLAGVRAGVDGGDQAAADAGIAALREAVGAATPAPAAAPPVAPDQVRDAPRARPGARDAATAPPLAAPGPPALAADAGLANLARAWEAEQAKVGEEAGQGGAAPDGAPPAAGQPSPGPASPASGAAQRAPDPAQVRADVAAIMGGVDRRRAEGTGGGVQVAQAGPPGAAMATGVGVPGPAERDGMTHWGPLPRPGSQPVPGAVRSRDWRPLQGAGQVALGTAGLAVGGALAAAGAAETGLGILTTPAGGIGVPVAAGGVATMALGAAVTVGSGAVAYEGIGNILAPFRDPRPLPPGVLPPQDPAASAEAVRQWLAANPPPGAAVGLAAPASPVPDLSGARVNLGPVALSPAPPMQPLPGFVPPAPVVPTSTANPAPPPAMPTSTVTPIPDGPMTPPHTGNTDGLHTDLGNQVEGFTTHEPLFPSAVATINLGNVDLPRTPDIGSEASMADLAARTRGARPSEASVPGIQGVVLTDDARDPSVLFPDMHRLSDFNGIEYNLSRRADGRLVLRSGAANKVRTPTNEVQIAHTHPDESENLPSETDIRNLNDTWLVQWERDAAVPPPRATIVWGSGQGQTTEYSAVQLGNPAP